MRTGASLLLAVFLWKAPWLVRARCGESEVPVGREPSYFQSPGYPHEYPKSMSCTWRFRAPTQHVVQVEVLDSRIEFSYQCSEDHVIAFDGNAGLLPFSGFHTTLCPIARGNPISYSGKQKSFFTCSNGLPNENKQLQRWCGVERPILRSTGSILTLHFRTDAKDTRRGFRLRLAAIPDGEEISDYCPDEDLPAVQLSARSESRFLILRPGNRSCQWGLEALQPGFHVQLVTVSIFLQDGVTCSYDRLLALEGQGGIDLAMWCGRERAAVVSPGRQLTLLFRTSQSYMGPPRHFRLQFRQVPVECKTSKAFEVGHERVSVLVAAVQFLPGLCPLHGSRLFIPAQSSYSELTSPNFPENYPNFRQCHWRLEAVNPDDVIEVRVLTSDLRGGDYVDFVYGDYPYQSSQKVGSWSGSQTPTFYSDGRHLTLHFRSDLFLTGKGFRLQFRQINPANIYPQTSELTVIILSVLGSLIFILVLGCFVMKCRRGVWGWAKRSTFSLPHGKHAPQLPAKTELPPLGDVGTFSCKKQDPGHSGTARGAAPVTPPPTPTPASEDNGYPDEVPPDSNSKPLLRE